MCAAARAPAAVAAGGESADCVCAGILQREAADGGLEDKDKQSAGVIGATGYAGLELQWLLLAHPHAEVTAVSSVSYAGQAISAVYPQLTGLRDLTLTDDGGVIDACDVVFTSMPAGRGAGSPPVFCRAGS